MLYYTILYYTILYITYTVQKKENVLKITLNVMEIHY